MGTALHVPEQIRISDAIKDDFAMLRIHTAPKRWHQDAGCLALSGIARTSHANVRGGLRTLVAGSETCWAPSRREHGLVV